MGHDVPTENGHGRCGQQVPFDEFLAEHLTSITGAVRRVGRRAGVDEDDLLQEVLLILYQRFHGLRDCGAAAAYASRIAVTVVRKWAREQQRLEAHEWRILPDRTALPADPLEVAIRAEAVAALRGALEQMKPRQRTVVRLRLRGLNRAEIATALGESDTTIKALLQRALDELKRARRRGQLLVAPAPTFHEKFGRRAMRSANRRSVSVAAGSPAVVALVAYTFGVAQFPIRVLPPRDGGAHRVSTARQSPERPVDPASEPRSPAANPVAGVIASTQERDEPSNPPPRKLVNRPRGRVCVGAACVGDERFDGYELCVEHPAPGANRTVCATQSAVDPCPLVPTGQTVVTCREHQQKETIGPPL